MGFPWQTDFYIDASATGTGSGDTPTNAATFVSNNSVFTSAGSIQVRAWVRRHHVESINGGNLGPNNMFDGTKSIRHFIIGWPNSGDPWYDERPAAGISAGWDSDVTTRTHNSSYGFNFPTLVSSRNDANGARLWSGLAIFNMNFDNLSSADIGQTALFSPSSANFFHNILFTNRGGPTREINLSNYTGRFGTLNTVTSGGPVFIVQSSYIEELIIHSASIVVSGAISNKFAGNFWARRIYNYSNSIDFMINVGGGHQPGGPGKHNMLQMYIERVSGVKPYSGWNGIIGPYPQNSTMVEYYRVDDWYGEGPVSGTGQFGPHQRLCSSAEAIYAANRAMIVECASWGGGWPRYGDNSEVHRPVRKYFNLTSGGAITIFQPVYVSSTAVFSLSNGTMLSFLGAKGCMPKIITQSHIITGSAVNWSGTKAAGGVAYTIATTYTPQETVNAIYECTIPTLIQSGDTGRLDYLLFGEPWAV